MRRFPATPLAVLFLSASLAAGAAQAQTAAQPATPSTAANDDGGHHRLTWRERFAEANTTHDGKLTLDQAKAGFPAMAHLFPRIDKDGHGYITTDDVSAYYEARRAARKAAAGGGAPAGAS